MVDAIVSFAVQRLGDFLIQEAAFLSGVKKEVVSLQNELKWMRSFLKDAEQKQDDDERVRVWVSEIQDIAYETEDVLETFFFKADLYVIGKDIEKLKNRVLEISRRRVTYGINDIGTTAKDEGTRSGGTSSIGRDLRITTSYADEEHVVGFEDDAQFLREKLVSGDPRRSVISIFGMGGLGKTTLARKLYNNNNTKFDLRAWICVSQEWKTRDLLERLIKSFKKPTKDDFEMLEKMKDYDMELHLRQLLEGRQYLVVIDDIWQKEAWESLRRAFPDNTNGSRIIITTRIQAVAELSDTRTYVHKLRFLRPDESWQLFCNKAFLDDNRGAYPSDMEKLGEEMVAICRGLPLALIVLGGLLSRKPFREWHVVKERIWRELEDNSLQISSLLALSYRDLPHELKSCFLYLSIFPEDYLIDVEKLIQLWIAEEFITQRKGLDLEEVAENCLKELIGRSLIQVVKRNWRTISTCRVHDLLLDLAVEKAKELNFLHICDATVNSAPSPMACSYKRIAFRSESSQSLALYHSHQQVRTFSILKFQISYKRHEIEERLLTLVQTSFKLLRVLDLEGDRFITGRGTQRFFEAIKVLIHLRYLGLKDTILNELSESLGHLQALQTLEVSRYEEPVQRQTRIRMQSTRHVLGSDHPYMLPREICKLKQLRHLIGFFKTKEGSLRATPLLFEELTNLQTLKNIDIDGWLKQKKEEDEFALNAFAKLQNLKFLSVRFYSDYMVSVQPLLKCRHLIELKMYGRIGSLPEDMYKSLSELKSLELGYSFLVQDPMPALKMLPNLVILRLNELGVEIMTCTATGFSHFEVFKLSGASTKLQAEEGAMPRLRALSLGPSIKGIIPERWRSLLHVESFMNWVWEPTAY